MHPQSPPLTIGGTVLKESDDLVILGVTFDSKLTFQKHLRFVSRADSSVFLVTGACGVAKAFYKQLCNKNNNNGKFAGEQHLIQVGR